MASNQEMIDAIESLLDSSNNRSAEQILTVLRGIIDTQIDERMADIAKNVAKRQNQLGG